MYKHITTLSKKYEIILGSGSPRRVKLLEETGISFTQIIPSVDESLLSGEPPTTYAKRLAIEKAESINTNANRNQIVIGCDTIVVLDDTILGKPEDESDAKRILMTLSGKKHRVYTSLAIAGNRKLLVEGIDYTEVYFNAVSESQIEEYIATGEPMDKAGAYGIQGMGAFLVDRIEGNLDTVIGFPRGLLNNLAERIIN